MLFLHPSTPSVFNQLTHFQSSFSFSSTKLSTWLEFSHYTHINVQQVLGRVIHISVDAILVSAVLAGIKRSTGIQ
jgi:hypothetical protein